MMNLTQEHSFSIIFKPWETYLSSTCLSHNSLFAIFLLFDANSFAYFFLYYNRRKILCLSLSLSLLKSEHNSSIKWFLLPLMFSWNIKCWKCAKDPLQIKFNLKHQNKFHLRICLFLTCQFISRISIISYNIVCFVGNLSFTVLFFH